MDVALDHLVITVASIEESVTFYTRVLGMRHLVRDGRHALHFDGGKINLHEVDHTFDPKAAHPTPGSGDLCFRTTATLDAVREALVDAGIAVEEGPVERSGALGAMTSVYVRDPDRNLIEISHY